MKIKIKKKVRGEGSGGMIMSIKNGSYCEKIGGGGGGGGEGLKEDANEEVKLL